MKKTINRPERLSIENLDGAVQEALQRVAKAHELSQEECSIVNGAGPVTSGPVGRMEPQEA